MKDIADRVGVSKNTVSLALRNRPGVSQQMRERIRKAAIELNYAGFGGLELGTEKIIVVLVPESIHVDSPFYHPVILGMEQYGSQQGMTVVIRTLRAEDEVERTLPNVHAGLRAAGIITVGNVDRNYIRMVLEAHIPLVAVDNAYTDLPVDCVLSDNHGGAGQAVRHLLDAGHTRIGYCGPIYYARSFYERWVGFTCALAEAGVSDFQQYSLIDYASNVPEIHSPEHLLERLSLLPELPSAFFCANDRIAIAMLNALHRRGLRVPDDISLVGFDNQADVHMMVPSLTTVNVSRRATGRRALEMLIDALNGKHPEPACLRLYTNLVKRDSVAAPPGVNRGSSDR